MHTHILPFGPQHPALEESIYFKLKVDGEEIRDLDINLGYEHKGVEKSFENRPWEKNIFLASRICGICNHEHSSAYVQGVEKLLNIKVPRRARYIRTILTEFERIQSHLLISGILAHEMGFETLFMYCWREREHALEAVEIISGKRVHYDINSIGGVRRDIPKDMYPKLYRRLDKIESLVNIYEKTFIKDSSVKARTKNIGILKKSSAEKFCAVGPLARASGVNYDIRKVDPYQAFDELNFKVILSQGEDCLARALVRFGEIKQSISIIRQALEKIPEGEFRAKRQLKLEVPKGETISRVEAPRGELFYYIVSDGKEKPYRVRVRTPTYANFASLKEMMIGSTIADAPVIVASMDPCISCCDRMQVLDVNTNKSKIMNAHEMIAMKEV